MKNIKLPGYKTILANEVFGKETKPLRRNSGEKVPATELIHFIKSRIPTENEVIEFIRKNAREVALIDRETIEESGVDSISYFLGLLNETELEGIISGNEEIISHLKRHCPKESFPEGTTYLKAFNGIVPTDILGKAKELAKSKGSTVYGRVIKTIRVQNWTLTMMVGENGLYPSPEEVEYLIGYGITNSNVFNAEGDFQEYQTIVDKLRMFYSVLNSQELIDKIPDSSKKSLRVTSEMTLHTFSRGLTISKFLKLATESGLVLRTCDDIEEGSETIN